MNTYQLIAIWLIPAVISLVLSVSVRTLFVITRNGERIPRFYAILASMLGLIPYAGFFFAISYIVFFFVSVIDRDIVLRKDDGMGRFARWLIGNDGKEGK